MQRLIITLLFLLLSCGISFAQETEQDIKEKKQHVEQMAQDSTMWSLIMDRMAQDPEMRRQMMQRMMESMNMDGMDSMHKMMNDPEMKEQMQRHMEMMQDSSMMKKHMMCMEMMGQRMEDHEMMHDEHHE